MNTTADDIRATVRDHYAKVSAGKAGCAPGCCGAMPAAQSELIGYSAEQLATLPDGADMGLGCGNPHAIAALQAGETVLDLGAGGGFDAFLAARAVGPTGKVIGVDMTPEMVSLARTNASKVQATNVEFRLGEIEHLPVSDASVDVILSNCVVNLSPDKPAVYREAFRVLKVGGRIAISDVVAIAPIPAEVLAQTENLSACVSGAAPLDDVRRMLLAAGFADIEIKLAPRSEEIVNSWAAGAARYIASATIEARRAATSACCPPTCCP